MPRQKLIILGSGALVLAVLSIILFIVDSDQQVIQTEEVNTANTEESAPDIEPEETTPTQEPVNVETSEGNTSDVPSEQEDSYRSAAQEALEEHTPEDSSPFSPEAFEDHALLFTIYQQIREDSSSEDTSPEEAAEWISLELTGWKEFAEENYDFNYDSSSFNEFVSEEQALTLEEDAEVRLFIDELEEADEELGRRQLEFQFALPYIWHEIQEEAASEYDVDPENTSEWNQLYFEIEQRVFEYIAEDHPEFFEGNSDS
jgi:hypothetical protein